MRLPNYFLPERNNTRPIATLDARYGRLTVLSVHRGKNGSGALARCVCICGEILTVRAVELRCGLRRSCHNAHPCSECGRMVAPTGEASHRRAHQRRRAAQIRSVA